MHCHHHPHPRRSAPGLCPVLAVVLCCGLPSALRAQADAPGGTRIPGPVTGGRFVPPPPPPPPASPPPDMRVESAVTSRSAGGSLQILRGSPSSLPDIPAPPPPPAAEQAALRQAFLARHRPPVSLNFGATVFDESVSLVQWRHPADPARAYEAVAGADFALFTGVSEFLHEGVPHRLFLLHQEIDTRPLREGGFGGYFRALLSSLPAVPAGGFLILRGDPHDPEGTAPLRALMDLLAVEKGRLAAAQAERRQALLQAAEWQRLHPSPPEPAAHQYWLRPHRNSRYLSTPQPREDGR